MEMSSRIRSGAWRARWAAVGAALAVTLGAGGIVAVNAASSAPSSFVAIDPARVYDGRIDSYAQSGPLAPNRSKTISIKDGFDLEGDLVTPNVVPPGATAITYNITVTGATGPNFVAVTPGDATTFTASAINFTGTDLANAGSVQIDTNRRITLWGGSNSGSTFVIVDVTGYYLPAATGGTGSGGGTNVAFFNSPSGNRLVDATSFATAETVATTNVRTTAGQRLLIDYTTGVVCQDALANTPPPGGAVQTCRIIVEVDGNFINIGGADEFILDRSYQDGQFHGSGTQAVSGALTAGLHTVRVRAYSSGADAFQLQGQVLSVIPFTPSS